MNDQVEIAVRLASVGYMYDTAVALTDITAEIYRGQNTVIIGGNGAGKSTLLRLIAGLSKPSSGTVQVHIQGRPAFVLQTSSANAMLPLSVEDCVQMGRWTKMRPWSRLSASDRAAVEEAIELLDIGAIRKKQLSDISGGQRQRALLAQGIAQGARLLLLDEPATGLDVDAIQKISDVITSLTEEGITVIQASHDLSVAREADRVISLKSGRLIGAGTPDRVLSVEQLSELF